MAHCDLQANSWWKKREVRQPRRMAGLKKSKFTEEQISFAIKPSWARPWRD